MNLPKPQRVTLLPYNPAHKQDIATFSALYEPTPYRAEDFINAGLIAPDNVSSLTPKRRAELLAGRRCAQAALRQLGATGNLQVLIGHDGAPRWPAGYTGSISHSNGLAIACVYRLSAGHLYSLGIDIQRPIKPPSAVGIAEWVCPELGQEADPTRITQVFSAKEAWFKALYGVAGRMMHFTDAHVVDIQRDALLITVANPSSWARPDVSWSVSVAEYQGYILTRCLNDQLSNHSEQL